MSRESDFLPAGRYDEAPMQERQRANDARLGGGIPKPMQISETRASNLVDRINECERRIEQIQAALVQMNEEFVSVSNNLQGQIQELNQFIGKR